MKRAESSQSSSQEESNKRSKTDDCTTAPRLRTAGVAHGERGKRYVYEDSELIIDDLVAYTTKDVPEMRSEKRSMSLYGIFDGHGGRNVADYCVAHMPAAIARATLKVPDSSVKEMKSALVEAFEAFDKDILRACREEKWVDGCTAVMVLFVDGTMYIANVGDALAALCRRTEASGSSTKAYRVFPLTREHTGMVPSERQRISKAGGFVDSEGRLAGKIEVSRALGDPLLKPVGLSAVPHVAHASILKTDMFVVLGCDGLWKVNKLDEAASFVHDALFNKAGDGSPRDTVKALVKDAVYKKKSSDNVTGMIVSLHLS